MPCTPIKIGDSVGIICGRGQRGKPCKYCGARGVYQCDFPVIRRGVRTTCDTWMCAKCRNEVAGNTDLCRPHFKIWQDNGCCFKIGDVKENS